MTISRNLREYLDSQGIDYEIMSHKVAYTAQETAAAQGVSGWQVVKSVVVYCDGDYVLLVLQAPVVVDFDLLKRTLDCRKARLANEQEMEHLFPGIELGAEPPFGNLYNLPVYVDKGLTEVDNIIFNAGSHTETIRMKLQDYMKLVNPKVIEVGKLVAA